ncbi:hypothetical protein TRAPUB_7462 [Trametes pubescens]|uniref:Uncharacterized protein n=1 Tax=Trametes pubescens TaxID=154538 RepID=A0A1M2V3H5_TRAPU|nr:hypothetical protein TRAPUB_7462 [Trametes pubescens]
MSPIYDRGDHSSLARAPHSDLPTPPQHGTMTGDIKAIFQSFLARLEYRDPHTMPNASLRADITADIVAWKAGLSAKMIDGLTDTACTLVETMFPHTDYAHQRLICLHTTYIVYIDDLGNRDPEALARFGQRVAARESLGDPVLERLAGQFRDMYDMYPSIGADCINAATLGGVAGNHVELTTEHMDVAPGALRYPSFVRGLTGYAAAFAFFNFVQGWRDPADGFYLQVVP